jgi:hypothetical protein
MDNDRFKDDGVEDWDIAGQGSFDKSSIISEVLTDVDDLVQSQGIATDEEVMSIIEDVYYDKVGSGEMAEDAATDELLRRIFHEWKKQKHRKFEEDSEESTEEF